MGTNHLEKYLEDVYKKECIFNGGQLEKEEVEFIKTGIETFVQKIVDKILESDSLNKAFQYILGRKDDDSMKDFHDSLEELYVPFQIETGNETVEYKKMPIVKVGSVYEGTKNGFPDEFDFIFLLTCGKAKLTSPSFSSLNNAAFRSLKTIISDKDVPLSQTFPCGKGKLSFEFEERTEVHGPAVKLKFIYKNYSGDEKPIHVDLVPAHKMIVGNKNCTWFTEYVYETLKQNVFNECVLKAGTCLNVGGFVSFTETEVHFIRNILSKEHVKVYRILKFLINGHHACEDLQQAFINQQLNYDFKIYSSYNIKTMMIYHHDECANTDKTNIGPCVLQVLEEISKYAHVKNFPNCSYECDDSKWSDESDDSNCSDESDDSNCSEESDDSNWSDESDESDDSNCSDESDDSNWSDESDDSNCSDESDDSNWSDESDDSNWSDESDDSNWSDESDDSNCSDESDDSNWSDESDDSAEFYLIKEVRSLIEKFRNMKVLEDNYDYARYRMKSLSLQGYERFIKSIPEHERHYEIYAIL